MKSFENLLICIFLSLLTACGGGGGSTGGGSGSSSSAVEVVPAGTVSLLTSISNGTLGDIALDNAQQLHLAVNASSSSEICQFSLTGLTLSCPGVSSLAYQINHLSLSSEYAFVTSLTSNNDQLLTGYATSNNTLSNVTLGFTSGVSLYGSATYGNGVLIATSDFVNPSPTPVLLYCTNSVVSGSITSSCSHIALTTATGGNGSPLAISVIPSGCSNSPSTPDLVIVGYENNTIDEFCISNSTVDASGWQLIQPSNIDLNQNNLFSSSVFADQQITAMSAAMINGVPAVFVGLVNQSTGVGTIEQVTLSSQPSTSIFLNATTGAWSEVTQNNLAAGLCNLKGLSQDASYLYVANASSSSCPTASSANTLLKVKLP